MANGSTYSTWCYISHYNLHQVSFAKIKLFLNKDVKGVVTHRCLKEDLPKGNIIFILEWHKVATKFLPLHKAEIEVVKLKY